MRAAIVGYKNDVGKESKWDFVYNVSSKFRLVGLKLDLVKLLGTYIK